jgi:NAD(P)-dependent dehydrogenase (short-subunit alcohol dehydrogenase family)
MTSTTNTPAALVTGSGAGIGRAIAIQLAADGYAIGLNSRSVDPVNTTEGAYEVQSVIRNSGGRAEVCRADISVAEHRQKLVNWMQEEFGRIDLLVNNAGVAPEERIDLLNATEESFDRVLNINLKGPYFLTQAVARLMIEQKQKDPACSPRIAFITSISAYTSSPSRGEYCVSKAGLTMAAMLYSDRLGEYGIPVIEIRPGITKTRMTEKVQDKYDQLIADGLLPLRRWGQPEDVARAISAFARGDLDYCTGSAIEAGGGFHIHRL